MSETSMDIFSEYWNFYVRFSDTVNRILDSVCPLLRGVFISRLLMKRQSHFLLSQSVCLIRSQDNVFKSLISPVTWCQGRLWLPSSSYAGLNLGSATGQCCLLGFLSLSIFPCRTPSIAVSQLWCKNFKFSLYKTQQMLAAAVLFNDITTTTATTN